MRMILKVFILLVVLLLQACGGGNSASNNSTNQVSVSLSGIATKGPIDNALVSVYKASDMSLSTPIGQTRTDEYGNYKLILDEPYSGIVVVKVTQGSYQDEATGDTVSLDRDSNHQLISVAKASTQTNTIIAITPLTDLAYKYLKNTQPTENSISSAKNFIATQFGLEDIDITQTIPDDISVDTAVDTDAGRYGTVLAAFSQAAQTKDNGNNANFNTINNIIADLNVDLTDGIFDSPATITNALRDIQNNDRIKHNTIIITTISNTIASSFPPNIHNNIFHHLINGIAINPIVINNTGGAAVIWSVSPTLPAGLILASSTIYGTPTIDSTLTHYIITASNVAGVDTSRINIEVKSPPLINNISNNYTFRQHDNITNITLRNDNDNVYNWIISPRLTQGLAFNNGVISGNPRLSATRTSYSVFATNYAGTSTISFDITIHPALPSIHSQSLQTFVVNSAINDITFANDGGIVANWTINPALPSGLNFNQTTGIISGTPIAVSAEQIYSVIASNITGSDSANIAIVVNDQRPDILNISAKTFVVNKTIGATISFTNNGGIATSWVINPSLPNGLVFDNTTGNIYGTPSEATNASTYTITATNITGSDSANIVIAINPIAPNIADIANKLYIQNSPITPVNFINSGGGIDYWAINRPLPVGLNFNTNTGVISGIPTEVSAQRQYLVTASNISGANVARIVISVNPATPNINISNSNVSLIKDVVIADISFTNNGGIASLWAISPNLPQGLNFNTNTGVISGMPTNITPSVTLTITASNITGSHSIDISLVVMPSAPILADISVQSFIRGIAITEFSSTNNGGLANIWSISPNLPSGLVLNTTTGVISGTPNNTSNLATWTITASNTYGYDTKQFSIIVHSKQPDISITIEKNYTAGIAITPFTLTNNGGLANSWHISPSLPEGLAINNTTGEISGTPNQTLTTATLTITAVNNSGSSIAYIVITINEGAPDIVDIGIKRYFENIAITPVTFNNDGGIVTTWTIAPNLTNGLTFDNTSGTISGIPNNIADLATWTVSASNISGLDSAIIAIEVYPATPNIANIAHQNLIKGATITNINFVNSGSVASSWTITPALPSGLVFNEQTGEISGLPTINSTLTTYSVVASNITGSNSASIVITVRSIFSISGKITAAVLIGVDSDVNDASVTNVSNNTASSAQNISNYYTIHGFATADRLSSGNFQNITDVNDVYKVSLLAGQRITLHIADHAGLYGYSGDLDLWLFDANDLSLIAYSFSVSEFENIMVPIDGEYFILVDTYSGSSKYSLSLNSNSKTNIINNSVDFISHQSVISYVVTNTGNSDIATQVNTVQLAQENVLDDDSRIALAQSKSQFLGELASNNLVSYDKLQTLQNIKKTSIKANVQYVEPNYIYRVLTTEPNDSYYNLQWHYRTINLPQAWDITTGSAAGRDIIVAVIDTGVFLAHNDLSSKLVAGYDFISDADNAGDGDGIDNTPDDIGDGEILGISSWHGTHVAGTIGADTNNNAGVAGVSWGAKIMPLRVLGRYGGSSYDISQALLYAAGLANNSGTVPAQKADIINLSLGGGGHSSLSQDVYNRVRAAGVIVIAAAGNSNNSQLFYPASYDGVVSVSAVDYQNNKAPYSNYGTKVDIAAPGGNTAADVNSDGYVDGILSTLVNASTGQRVGNYAFYQGTSMAAPHITGVASLMKAVYPDLTPTQFDSLIYQGKITNDIANNGITIRDNIYGYGVIDAYKAVREAQALAQGGEVGLTPANISVSPEQLNIGFADNGFLNVINIGQATTVIIDINTTDSWLSVATVTVDQYQLGDYRVNIDRSDLTDGDYNGTINFIITTGVTVSVSVNMTVGSALNYADIGNIKIALITTNNDVAQVIALDDGVYNYSFENVAAGEYYIVAGSDIDNDKKICQLGENCGAYPVLSRLGVITVSEDDDNTDISFVVDILSSSYNGANNSSSFNINDIIKITR